MRRLHGVVYPDTAPPAGQQPPEAAPDDEMAMALRYVRQGFDPPLPDAFAHWYNELLEAVCNGYRADTLITVPQEVTDLGYTFERAMHAADDSLTMDLADALRVFGRDDLLAEEHDSSDGRKPGVVRASTHGFTALAAALAAFGIPASVRIHHHTGTCTLQLGEDEAAQLAERLVPAEGSLEDELGIALGLLDAVTQDRDLTCSTDHHGRCQEHSAQEYEGTCAEPQAHAFLVRHNVREAP